jgi:hypothetical protein
LSSIPPRSAWSPTVSARRVFWMVTLFAYEISTASSAALPMETWSMITQRT